MITTWGHFYCAHPSELDLMQRTRPFRHVSAHTSQGLCAYVISQDGGARERGVVVGHVSVLEISCIDTEAFIRYERRPVLPYIHRLDSRSICSLAGSQAQLGKIRPLDYWRLSAGRIQGVPPERPVVHSASTVQRRPSQSCSRSHDHR